MASPFFWALLPALPSLSDLRHAARNPRYHSGTFTTLPSSREIL
eukprot:CAMPEP_0174944090 /NCGR_PEP_ID=MMETSP1355-20121228/78278_1 /TAXON_ID=464990 /ORGANISM="Hemiselmis tepida, Strain CCMP443" /LENGTH=43 /DNA_ID= /DNA_START= /DNA_END= /DNA_ORIENTATION=